MVFRKKMLFAGVVALIFSAGLILFSGFPGNIINGNAEREYSAHAGILNNVGNVFVNQSSVSGIRNMLDFAPEAESKGFRNINSVPRKIFVAFEVVSRGAVVARVPLPLAGITDQGVVYVQAKLPAMLPPQGVDIFVWRNGQVQPIQRGAQAQNEVSVQIPLVNGENYICFIIKLNNRIWGRSRVIRVQSPGAEEKIEPQPVPPSDYWPEANGKGLNPPPQQPVKQYLCFTQTARGNVVTDIPSPLDGTTGEGILDANIVLPKDVPGKNVDVYLWNNGSESLAKRRAGGGARILSKVVLASGYNYICTFMKSGGKYVGRSPMVRVKSNVMSSIARFELSWDGSGDVDLHLDCEPKGLHVYYGSRTTNNNGTHINLDVDNMSGFGPENIRVFSLGEETNFRCFVNYYSGGDKLNVTVRYFDRTNKLVNTYNKVFTRGMIQGSADFHSASWVVGDFKVAP
ncbi:MAG TPA: hypothetical protein PLI62_19050 [Spirochaetota bacterium]|nr:hypothetical protein [Spirochaetota bacterium]